METSNIKATSRTLTGNSPARELRRNGQIPAILYGKGKDNLMLSVTNTDIQALIRRGGLGRKVLALDINGDKKNVQIKEMQFNHLTNEVLHIDFYEIAAGEKLTVTVPVVALGKAIGTEYGGILQNIRRELTLLCPYDKIPEAIEIDISNLNVGESIHVKDVQLPEGVSILHAEDTFTIFTVVATRADAGETEAAEGGAEEATTENA